MKIILLLSLILNLYAAHDLGEIVYSSKTNRTEEEFSAQNFKITGNQLESKSSILEGLRTLPGVDIIQNGGPGSTASISIRGSERRHTLVLINGIRVSDRSDIDGGFDFKLISENMIERVEVLSGSQTLLYGSDAMGGVINIITKNYSSHNSIDLKVGDKKSITVTNSMTQEKYSFFITGFYEESEIVSSSSNGSELDGYNQKGIYTNLNYIYNDNYSSELIFKGDINSSQLDEYNFSTGKTQDAQLEQITYSNLYSHKLKYQKGASEVNFSLSKNQTSRFEISDKRELFEGNENLASFSILRKITDFDFLSSIDYSDESFSQSGEGNVNNQQWSFSQSVIIENKVATFDIGSRYTNNLISGDNISSSLGVKSRSFGAQLSQGFKTPSLYQLKGRFLGTLIGNPNLKPEKVNSININYDYRAFSFSAFYNKYFDLIRFTDKYENIDQFESHGIGLSHHFKKGLHALVSSIDILSYNGFSSRVIRRPNQLYKLVYTYNLNDMIDLNGDYSHRSTSYEEINGINRRIEESGVFNLSVFRKIKSGKIGLILSNVFDDRNQSAYGYSGTPRMYQLNYKYTY